MPTPIVDGGIAYDHLCDQGTKRLDEVGRAVAETRRLAYRLQEAEETYYSEIPRLRQQLERAKDQVHRDRVKLQRHVAHCSDGCKRTTDGNAFAARVTNSWRGASYDGKPEVPGATELAAMLREGQTVQAIADLYQRDVSTIRRRLINSGFSSQDGRPIQRPKSERSAAERLDITLPDQPWATAALCAQTDPESFFPEKGGSTREAKKVCAGCTVAAECLDYAIDNDERFGIWGGLSERERRKIKRVLEARPREEEQESA